MDPRVSLSALCYYTTPLPDFIDELKRQGVGTTTLMAGPISEFGVEQTRDLLDSAGITVAALIPGLPVDLADPATWDSKRAELTDTIDIAVALGVPAVYTVSGSLVVDEDTSVAAFKSYIEPVVAYANAAGIKFLIEPTLPVYAFVSFVYTLKTYLRLAQECNVGLCLDVYHVWEDPDLERVLRDHIDLVGLVQIGDSQRDSDGNLQKQIPGEGNVGIAELTARIVDAGYRGAFDLEIDGPFIESVGVTESTERAVAYMQRALTAAPLVAS
ncbi:sugar phosphate isomerase/epimerase family protein [Gordonia insulae]|uniref:Xylose isomerase-like TIM barrel domain-containing protein n=1 Tax=Gordonia insulae TaxID=2420509 RepID=A0A3G8JN48_9ACTN|nr:sugar phosphate isomerase/epimerase family protein [Gordonia insulae]AZG45879.1 hypothetical protein D7316_02479 [Gordonia insulae]